MRDHHVTALAVGLLLTCTGLSPAPPDHVGLLLGRPPPPPRCTAFLTSRAIWWWHFHWPVSAQIPAERRLNRSVLDSSMLTSPPDTTLRMGSPKLKAGNENVLGLRPLCLWGREDLDRIRDLDAGPQGHHLLSLQLPFAKHRGRGKYSPLRPSTGKRKILQGGLTDVRTLTHY